MKKLFTGLLLLALSLTAHATNYYISITGSDAAAGTSTGAPWQTITKVNTVTLASGDSLLFKRGDDWSGIGIVTQRDHINYGAYGTGAAPVVSGLNTISSWTDMGGGVYKASVSSAGNNLIMVTMNGWPQQIGRWPNANETNHGYRNYEAKGTGYIIDSQLNNVIDWTGGDLNVRGEEFMVNRVRITSHSGMRLDYRMVSNINSGVSPALQNFKLKYGFFISNHRQTLDQLGEWWLDTTAHELYMYFGGASPGSYTVKYSSVNYLLNIGSHTGITVRDMYFEGANVAAVNVKDGDDISILNCSMINNGAKGVMSWFNGNILIQGCNIKNSLCNGIQASARSKSIVTIRRNTVTGSGMYIGMGSYNEGFDYRGIVGNGASNILIENNTVDSSAYAAIDFNGSDAIIQNNYIHVYCYELHDGGGIYTFVSPLDSLFRTRYTNRIIQKNVILYGIGRNEGTTDNRAGLAAIYGDGRSGNLLIIDNTIGYSVSNGIHNNNPFNVTLRNNLFYKVQSAISVMKWSYGEITNYRVVSNKVFGYSPGDYVFRYTNAALNSPTVTTPSAALRSMGFIDSNILYASNQAPYYFEIYSSAGGPGVPFADKSFEGWKTMTGYDSSTTLLPAQPAYHLDSITGSNRITNGAFNTNILSHTVVGANTTPQWDNTNKISGGSLKLTFAAILNNKWTLVHSPIGTITAGKQYILRISTVGENSYGLMRIYLRKRLTPYTTLTPVQVVSFGRNVKNHEFLITATTTESNASYVLEIEQTCTTAWIDNISFYEAAATPYSLGSLVRFETNGTDEVKTISLGDRYVDYFSAAVADNTLMLSANSGEVLLKQGRQGFTTSDKYQNL